jgi:hypothetical protein
LLPESRRDFHAALAPLSAVVPSEHNDVTIFDFNVTPSADWEPWAEIAAGERLPRFTQTHTFSLQPISRSPSLPSTSQAQLHRGEKEEECISFPALI